MTEVLLAEDDEAIATPLSRALGREGYTVTVEQTGPAALARALEGSFDLLILDLGLPGWTASRCAGRSAPPGPTSPS